MFGYVILDVFAAWGLLTWGGWVPPPADTDAD
jgi:hypothetical protein